jgi:hypothetical protein
MNRPVANRWLILAAAAALQACSGGSDGGPPPDAPNAQLEEHLSSGKTALESALTTHATDDFLAAANHFSEAATIVGSGATSTAAERDQARFLGALARIALLADPYSDATANGLQDLGDVLDGFGFAAARADRATFDPSLFLECTDVSSPGPNGPITSGQSCQLRPLAADGPRSGALQQFLVDRIASGLRGAVALLENVSEGFAWELNDGGRVIQLDKTDALFLKALAQGMLATLELVGAYDLDVDLHALQADGDAGTLTPQGFADANPLFLTLRDAAKVPAARQDATDGIRSLQAALSHLRAETDDQSDDLVRIADQACTYSYDPVSGYGSGGCTTVYNPEQQLSELEDGLADALAFATATGTYRFDMGTADTSDDVVVDPGRFFAGLDLRALLPASFTAGAMGDRPALFPDPAFGGVLVSSPTDFDADVDGDGSPDLFGYTYFGSYLQGRHVTAPWGGLLYGTLALAPTGNTFVFTDWNQAGYPTSPGTWAYDRNVLTLTFDAALPSLLKTVVVTAERIDDASFEGPTRYLDAGGAELASDYRFVPY